MILWDDELYRVVGEYEENGVKVLVLEDANGSFYEIPYESAIGEMPASDESVMVAGVEGGTIRLVKEDGTWVVLKLHSGGVSEQG